MEFGHSAGTIKTESFTARIDTWGTGPFMFRINGKRIFFEDSDMFGPFVIRILDWNPGDRQPGEKSMFWNAYGMWRKAGRPLRGTGRVKVAVWKEPQPGRYWTDSRGIFHFLNYPDLPDGPYLQVPKPEPK
jgi:hypothetical protein